MHIERTRPEDVPTIMAIYDGARRFMRANGNPDQWPPTYPAESDILNDIAQENSYTLRDENGIAATFCLPFGPDPTYQEITAPGWLNDAPYGAIHRIAINQARDQRGLGTKALRAAEAIALARGISNLRIDTHPANLPMQKAILKNGFTHCGTLTKTESDMLRWAYHKVLDTTVIEDITLRI